MYRAFQWECAKGHTNTYVTRLKRLSPGQFEKIKEYVSEGRHCGGCRRSAIPVKFGELFTYGKCSNSNRGKQ